MKIGIFVGHSRKGDQGSVSVGGVSEFVFNTNIAAAVRAILIRAGIPAEVENYYAGNTYAEAMRWVAALAKRKGFTHAVELHFNSDNAAAKGHEFLHHRSSMKGRKLAQDLAASFQSAFPRSIPRDGGVKPIPKGGRGDLFVALTHCPAVICEPFFGSNRAEWNGYSSGAGQVALAEAIARGIAAHLGKTI